MRTTLLLLLVLLLTGARGQSKDTNILSIFLLRPGYRVMLHDSVFLCRSPRQLKTFLKTHAHGVTKATIVAAPEEPIDSVIVVMKALRKYAIRPTLGEPVPTDKL